MPAPSRVRSPNPSAAVLAQTTDLGSPASRVLPGTLVSVLLPDPTCLFHSCTPSSSSPWGWEGTEVLHGFVGEDISLPVTLPK